MTLSLCRPAARAHKLLRVVFEIAVQVVQYLWPDGIVEVVFEPAYCQADHVPVVEFGAKGALRAQAQPEVV